MKPFSVEVIQWWIKWNGIYSGNKEMDEKEAVQQLEDFRKIIIGLKNYHN